MHTWYDGQMAMGDDDNWSVSGTAHQTINRYGLGARGIDYMEYEDTNNSSNNSVGFPLYDGHGNMVMTIARNGSGYTPGNARTYDVWGSVRSGSATGAPNQRYCANLGHVADDESSMIYMRARYYEPASGRFVNQDPSMRGANWFIYGSDDPIGKADFNGREAGEVYRIVEQMYRDGKLITVFWEFFKDKSTGMAQRIHLAVTRGGYPDEEVESVVEMFEQDFLSDLGDKLAESAQEIEADFEFGEDILLEFEVIEIEEAGG